MKLVDSAFDLHRNGEIPTNTYLVDLDTMRRNAAVLVQASAEAGIKNYYMTKQFGRNPLLCKAIVEAGIPSAVAIDIDETKILHRNGFKVDHVGHLMQIPSLEVDFVVGKVRPEITTVYSFEKAKQIDRSAQKFGRTQKIMLRPVSPSDSFGPSTEGGTPVRELVKEVRRMSELRNIRVTGLTSFPSFRYDLKLRRITKTSNFETLIRAKSLIESETSTTIEQINAPGSSCTAGMKILAEEGATHAEPGHAFTGTTPWHAFDEKMPEIPAWVYVTEVSHVTPDRAYSISGGLPQSGYYGFFTMKYHQVFLYAMVEHGGEYRTILAEPPQLVNDVQAWPDFHTSLHQPEDFTLSVGDTVVFGFRPQVYVTRSKVAIATGIGTSNIKVVGIFDRYGNLLDDEDRPEPFQKLENLMKKV